MPGLLLPTAFREQIGWAMSAYYDLVRFITQCWQLVQNTPFGKQMGFYCCVHITQIDANIAFPTSTVSQKRAAKKESSLCERSMRRKWVSQCTTKRWEVGVELRRERRKSDTNVFFLSLNPDVQHIWIPYLIYTISQSSKSPFDF